VTDQDKAFARAALERKLLTIEQVEQVRVEVDRTGRPFEQVARERGFLPSAVPAPKPAMPRTAQPARRIPVVYMALLAASFAIFTGLLIATVVKMRERSRQDEDLALETERSRAEAERQAAEASRGYKRAVVSGNEAVAREQLAKARAAMARVEQMLLSGRLPPELGSALNEAFIGYNMYLKEIPDDAAVRVERARTHELRRNYDLAVADLERAIELNRDLEPVLKARVEQLRRLVARNPR